MPLFSPLACPARRCPPFETPPVPPLRTSAARGPPPAADAALRMPSNATHGATHPLQSKPVHVVKPSAPRGNSGLRRNGATASFRAPARRILIAPDAASPRRQTLRDARSSRPRPRAQALSDGSLHIYTLPRADISGVVSRETTGLPSEAGAHGEHAGEAVALGHAERGVLAEAHARALQRQRAALLRQRREVVFLAEVAEDDLPRPIAHQ